MGIHFGALGIQGKHFNISKFIEYGNDNSSQRRQLEQSETRLLLFQG